MDWVTSVRISKIFDLKSIFIGQIYYSCNIENTDNETSPEISPKDIKVPAQEQHESNTQLLIKHPWHW